MVFPFGIQEVLAVNSHLLTIEAVLKIGFVVVISTFLTYLLNLLSMKELKPTTVAVFIYLQPLFATAFAIILQKDELNLIKITAAILIFIGVYLVIKKPKHSNILQTNQTN